MAIDPAAEVSALETRVIEANAIALGLSVDQLMENAGRAVAEEVTRRLPEPGARVVVLAGSGNNGGDATCAAFYLAQWGHEPEVWLLKPPSEIAGASARRCWERAHHRLRTHVGVPRVEDLAGAALAVDGALGAGQSGELRSPYRETVDHLARAAVPTLSIDVPTGLGSAHAVAPRWTVALTSRKAGMTSANSGEILVRDIGIPAEAWEETGPGEFLRYPDTVTRRERGRSARVLVVGGGPFSGAPALAGLAALRSGAERAIVALPAPAADAVRAMSPDLIVRRVGTDAFAEHDAAALVDLASELRVHAIVLGMGAGRAPETQAMFAALLRAWRGRLPLLIDADALDALTPSPGGASHLVATPNPAELARVFGIETTAAPEARLAAARRRAVELGVTLLAKGSIDLITDGETTVRNPHHHPAATVGGVGDVLAGVVGGLLAQGLDALGAARLGAYWVGAAGATVAAQNDFALLATDVLAALPATLVRGRALVRPSL